jgi:spore germination protein GerM
MPWRQLTAAAIAGLAIAAGWFLFVTLPRWYGPAPPAEAPPAPVAAPPAAPERHIKATLYYVAEDGGRLMGVERDVPLGETPAAQARRIVEEQLKEPAPPLVSAIPKGTTLRALFVTPDGEAYVDLSPEASSAHPGGSREELFTVYAIVDALTTNLPAVTRVQILVGGKEVDTLAGHVDLRRPLQKNLKWTMP